MPTVPVIDQTAAPASQFSAPDVAPVRNASPGQAEALGQTLQQTGVTGMRLGGTIGDRLAEQVDDATVKQAETGFLNKVQSINYDPTTGFLHQKGQNAIDQYAPAKQAITQSAQDAVGKMTNPIQKQMLNQVLQQHLLSIGRVMSNHDFVQKSQYAGESAVNRASTYATAASNAYSSYGQTDADGNATGDFAKAVGTAEQETLTGVSTLKGAPAGSDIANGALLNLHTQIAAGTLTQMMDNRAPYSKIQAVYNDMKGKGWLNMQATDTLGKMVKSYSEQELTRTSVARNLSEAQRASQGQPTSSTGTPDYEFPIKGATVTSQPYDPEQGGVQMSVASGSNIQAPADGKVIQVGKNADGNFSMQIQQGDGSVTTFSGLNAAGVKVGDSVQRGESVATSGTQEGSSTPSVLWSLADKNGNSVDPTKAGLPPVDTSKITDEKVLTTAIAGIRKDITDPYLQAQAVNEAQVTVRHNQQMQNAQATQVYKSASDAFYAGGVNWRKIPPSIFAQLTPEQQQGFKDKQTEHVLQQYNEGQAFKTMNEVDTVSNFFADPQSITKERVEAAKPKLANHTFLSLMRIAGAFKNDPQAVIEAGAINTRIKYYAAPAGVNVNPTKPEDKQMMNELTYKIYNDIDQIKSQNKGKATAEQVDHAIKQELIQRTISRPRILGAFNPLTILGSPTRTEQKLNFQLPTGATQVVPGSDGKMHYSDGTNDLGVVQ